MQTVGVQYANTGRTAADQLRAIVLARESRRQQLSAASVRLRDAAEQLTGRFQRDNAFVQGLAQLQVRSSQRVPDCTRVPIEDSNNGFACAKVLVI
jgi:hypothetical protein